MSQKTRITLTSCVSRAEEQALIHGSLAGKVVVRWTLMTRQIAGEFDNKTR